MIQPTITARSLIQYGFIALPIAFAGFPLYVLAPDFYVTHHNLSLTTIGALLLSIRLFDAIQDPVIGWLTDKLQGRFKPYLAVAGIILCMAIFGLFNVVYLSPAIWFSLCMFVAVGAYSVLTIMLGAWATLWTTDHNDQTRIAGAREAFGLIGLVIAVSMPELFSQILPQQTVFIWYSAIFFILMLMGIFGFSRLSPDYGLSKIRKIKSSSSIFTSLRTLSADSLLLFAIYGISALASSIPAILVIFYIRDLLGAEHLTGLFLLIYFLSGALGMPIWKNISARFGKYQSWCLSNLLAVTGFIGAFLLGKGDIWSYAIVCLVSGVALGADLIMPPSILADDIHRHGNNRYSGMHYAFLAFLTKASMAFASAITFPALDALGFVPQSTNSREALMYLAVFYALLPSALKLLAAGLVYVFFIRSQSGGLHENQQKISRHRSSYDS